jgi:hypothetical protein
MKTINIVWKYSFSGSSPIATPDIGIESNMAPEKRQTATNLESGYRGTNEGERPVRGRRRKSREMETWGQEPSK